MIQQITRPKIISVLRIVLILFLNIPVFPFQVQAEESLTMPVANKLNLHFSITDTAIPSFDLPIRFTRTYNSSQSDELSSLGYGWTHSFNMSLFEQKENDLVIFKDPVSKRYAFKRELDGSYITPLGIKAKMIDNPDGGRILTFKDMAKYLFNTSGLLEKIETRNRNTLRLSYDDSGSLLNVVSSSGARLDLTYDKQNRLTQINGSNQRATHYLYDADGNLIKTINFLGDAVEYAYDAAHNVVSIKDQLSRTTQFTYGTEKGDRLLY